MAGTEVEIDGVPPAATALEVLNTQIGGMIVLSPDLEVILMNDAAEGLVPDLGVGEPIRPLLDRLSEEQKIDRLLFNRERVLAPAQEGGPDLYWLMHPQELDGGNRLLYLWDPDITEDMHERRVAFLAGAAHEIRSPLTAIVGFAEILGEKRDNLTEGQLEALTMIEQNARYLNRLVGDVFDMTRNSFGELPLDLDRVEVGKVTAEAAHSLQPEISKKSQTLILEVADDIPSIEADPGRLQQIVTNLVRNAHAHCPEGTRIEVSCQTDRETGEVVIAVADDGPGLPFEEPDEAFRSFRSAGPQDPGAMSGAGIGLSMTKRLVQLHRGRILVSSANGRGTRIEIRLPIDRAAAKPSYEPGPA
ncbi:MAG: sensor histidine kinase [Solirubrobacterales bacterium]